MPFQIQTSKDNHPRQDKYIFEHFPVGSQVNGGGGGAGLTKKGGVVTMYLNEAKESNKKH